MTEVLMKSDAPEHFDVHHEDNGETIMCMTLDNECAVLVEVADGYSEQELAQLIESTQRALSAIDRFTDGRASLLFRGLHIKIGEGVADGGGVALSDENMILLNGRRLLLSLAEMRAVSGSYDPDELSGGTIDEHSKAGALEYVLVHEAGHILDERTESGEKKHRVSAEESPTKYGREADQWHEHKDHEAFAEGFAHMVYDMPVSDKLAEAVHQKIEAKFAES